MAHEDGHITDHQDWFEKRGYRIEEHGLFWTATKRLQIMPSRAPRPGTVYRPGLSVATNL
jgi:hypothetical protein